jgi:hypothetical protein
MLSRRGAGAARFNNYGALGYLAMPAAAVEPPTEAAMKTPTEAGMSKPAAEPTEATVEPEPTTAKAKETETDPEGITPVRITPIRIICVVRVVIWVWIIVRISVILRRSRPRRCPERKRGDREKRRGLSDAPEPILLGANEHGFLQWVVAMFPRSIGSRIEIEA